MVLQKKKKKKLGMTRLILLFTEGPKPDLYHEKSSKFNDMTCS